MLYYAVASHVGQLGVLVPASGLLGGCFAIVCRREWGNAARGPSLTFAGTAPFIMMVGGTYPFLAGIATSLTALVLLQRRRSLLFGVAVLLTLAFSPLSFSLLCAVLAGLLLGQSSPLRSARVHRAAFAAVVVVFLVGALLQRAFAQPGLGIPTTCGMPAHRAGVLAGRAVGGRPACAHTVDARALFAAYLALNLIAFLLKGPIGSNPSRLFAIAGAPMLWLTANLNPRRSRLVVEPDHRAGGGAAGRPEGARRLLRLAEPRGRSQPTWRPALRFLHDDRTQIPPATGWRPSPPGATGRRTTSPATRCRWRVAGSGRRLLPPETRPALQRRDDAGGVPRVAAFPGCALRAAA